MRMMAKATIQDQLPELYAFPRVEPATEPFRRAASRGGSSEVASTPCEVAGGNVARGHFYATMAKISSSPMMSKSSPLTRTSAPA